MYEYGNEETIGERLCVERNVVYIRNMDCGKTDWDKIERFEM